MYYCNLMHNHACKFFLWTTFIIPVPAMPAGRPYSETQVPQEIKVPIALESQIEFN